ncbi:hypothetical protein [Phenylobacterium sp. J367]|uniref:hypothetical protein n=1 Tax=Phenylobacterium sp. J367 TaxID=2898435 RepID=UPI002150F29D|nr:hypothetical protein [Phenylobacterium sp. J367]MCR5878796.1 hypothetical protein [Phenylobacterium sp. J367]
MAGLMETAMAVVRLGADGEIDVLVPPTAEEIVEAEVAVHRVIEALARVAEEQDCAARQAQAQLLEGSEQHEAEPGDYGR